MLYYAFNKHRTSCTLFLYHVEVAQQVISFARSAWTQIQTLKCGCSPEYHQAQLRSPQDRQGNEAASALSQDTGKEIIQEVAAGTFLPGFLSPGTKHRGHVALRECHHLLLKVNQVMTSNPLQRFTLSGLHLSARHMKNTLTNQWVDVRPVSGSSMPDPSQSEAKASMRHELIK